MPRISVVVPCRNETQHIVSLLEALRAQDFHDFEVVLVDGHSNDGTEAIVRGYAEAHPDLSLRVLDNPHLIIPAALNLGIRQARGEVIVRMDGHARPAPNYLSRCLAVLEESGAAVVGGAWDVRPGGPGATAEAIALATSSRLGAGNALYRLALAGKPADADTVPFGCFRRQTWIEVGGYDETLLSNEDYEFNWRVRKSGGRVRFDPSIRCGYFARPTLRGLLQQYWRYGWWKGQMLSRHPSSLRLRQAVPILWAVTNAILWAASPFSPLAQILLALVWLCYLAVVCESAGWLARGRWAVWWAVIAAYGMIHLAWGCGAGLSWLWSMRSYLWLRSPAQVRRQWLTEEVS